MCLVALFVAGVVSLLAFVCLCFCQLAFCFGRFVSWRCSADALLFCFLTLFLCRVFSVCCLCLAFFCCWRAFAGVFVFSGVLLFLFCCVFGFRF